jgi:beta-mannosidase
MHGRIRSITGHRVQALTTGWEVAASEPDAIDTPAVLERAALDWTATTTPSTAASSLRTAGKWSLDGATRRFDAQDWWYRTRLSVDAVQRHRDDQTWLRFDGLATVADVWLNGNLLFNSSGMFTARAHRVDDALRSGSDNELAIRFRSLDVLLRERRPRPKWRTPMVENQQIRWFRSTLLGRTPGWSPPAQAVGPWRPVVLEQRRSITVDSLRIRANADGCLDVSGRAMAIGSTTIASADVVLVRDGQGFRANLTRNGNYFEGRLVVPNAATWWPHTHGDPALYDAALEFGTDTAKIVVDLGAIGFRSVAVNTADDGFAVLVNGASVFCRGAIWTPIDPVSLASDSRALDLALRQVVEGGMNMLRVGGMMVYEDAAFFDACDARGILVWQDCMFANMEYPGDDPEFKRGVTDEITDQLGRLQGRPSVAVVCGNSEGEQQAAMWGAPRDKWRQPLFEDHLARMSRDLLPDVPYWPSSTHGGAFPHQGSAGTASYYGVGAYLRPLEDARRADLRFASECLAFANISEPEAMKHMPGGPGTKVHDPSWKTRTPRDLGAGWDFDDVRDHYVSALYRVDPLQLRYADHERYLALGRNATGQVMADVFSEWRRCRSRTQGGLIWFLRDLWAGAGWGVIDASGYPKAAWYYLRRALAPVALSLSDEGGNGIGVHVVNDLPTVLEAEIEVSLYRFGEVRIARGATSVELSARSALEMNAAALFDDFLDLSYAYRFGPPSHDVVVAVLRDNKGVELARAFHFVPSLPSQREMDVGLYAEARASGNNHYDLVVRSRRLAQSVSFEVDGFDCSDNYFHLAPGEERRLVLRARFSSNTAGIPPRGSVHALNSATSATISLAKTT